MSINQSLKVDRLDVLLRPFYESQFRSQSSLGSPSGRPAKRIHHRRYV